MTVFSLGLPTKPRLPFYIPPVFFIQQCPHGPLWPLRTQSTDVHSGCTKGIHSQVDGDRKNHCLGSSYPHQPGDEFTSMIPLALFLINFLFWHNFRFREKCQDSYKEFLHLLHRDFPTINILPLAFSLLSLSERSENKLQRRFPYISIYFSVWPLKTRAFSYITTV